jgi:hypothetical protein
MNERENLLAKRVLPSSLSRISEVIGPERLGWFLTLLEDTDNFSNWRIQSIMREAFGIDLSPWIVKAWRDTVLVSKPTLLPELQKYKERPLTLICGRMEPSTDQGRESA